MENEKTTLEETAMEKFKRLDPEGKALAIGFILGYAFGKDGEGEGDSRETLQAMAAPSTGFMRIRELRKKCGMTQQQVADEIGVVRSAVANWEAETQLPKTAQLPQLAKVFGVSISELFA